MDYDFGDILDARSASGIDHFILVVGETSKKGQEDGVMYYIITSRVYAVFKGILSYFNDCLSRRDRDFLRFYSKEKTKTSISAHGSLSQAVFLDKETNYNTCLDVESMVVVNSDPMMIDKIALETLRLDNKVIFRDKLTKVDAFNLVQVIKHSNDVSPDKKVKVSTCFNRIKSTLV